MPQSSFLIKLLSLLCALLLARLLTLTSAMNQRHATVSAVVCGREKDAVLAGSGAAPMEMKRCCTPCLKAEKQCRSPQTAMLDVLRTALQHACKHI